MHSRQRNNKTLVKAGETRPWGHQRWERWQGPVLTVSVAVMAILAALWLGYEFWRLLWQPEELAGRPVHPGATDLIERSNEIRMWFSGRQGRRVYPPASYLMLWPLLGWLPLQWAITLWAVTSLAALGWLAALVVRESGVESRMARRFAALLPLSMYATGATIGNGQLILLVLPMLMAGILALRRGPASWPRDLGASLLILASLVKPSISAPFFWIVAFTTGRLRPSLLIVLGYVLLAGAASPFNAGGPVWQHYDWLVRGADVWLLLGVSAIAARLWMYHRWYDDLLILLPMITLVRIARRHTGPGMAPAGWLLACAVLTSLAPGGLFLLPPPWTGVYVIVQLTIWLAVLGYLLSWGRQRA